MDYVRGKTYRRPDDDPAWCIRALDEIARTFLHPIRVVLVQDGVATSGQLVAVKGDQVTLDMPREGMSVAIQGDSIESFHLIADPALDTSDELRGTLG